MSDFDYIIVGGGTAGCILAARLSEDPTVTVALLEAGPAEASERITTTVMWPTLMGTDLDWGYETAQESTGRSHAIPRGRVLGGSGATNAMAYLRGDRSDFDAWAQDGNDGWDYDSVLPFFKRAEHVPDGDTAYRGIGGPLHPRPSSVRHPLSDAYLLAAEQAGHSRADDLNAESLMGASGHDLMIVDGERESTASAYLVPALSRQNLTVISEVTVTRLAIADGVCTGLTYRDAAGETILSSGREVILCAGAIGSAHLLLVSGVGDEEQLVEAGIETVHHLPGVGANLQDHIILAGVSIESPQPLPAPSANLGEVTLFLRSNTSAPSADLQIVFIHTLLSNPWQVRPANSFTFGIGHMRPTSRGSLRVSGPSIDDKPTLDYNYLGTQEDVDALVAGVRAAIQISEMPAFDDWRAHSHALRDASDAEIVEAVRDAVQTYGHSSGTCRMGPGELAVVDAELRVHGIAGLRVADASVMPLIVSTNTNAATVMIAEKAASMIREATSGV